MQITETLCAVQIFISTYYLILSFDKKLNPYTKPVQGAELAEHILIVFWFIVAQWQRSF